MRRAVVNGVQDGDQGSHLVRRQGTQPAQPAEALLHERGTGQGKEIDDELIAHAKGVQDERHVEIPSGTELEEGGLLERLFALRSDGVEMPTGQLHRVPEALV
jgi:hypothetical protein